MMISMEPLAPLMTTSDDRVATAVEFKTYETSAAIIEVGDVPLLLWALWVLRIRLTDL